MLKTLDARLRVGLDRLHGDFTVESTNARDNVCGLRLLRSHHARTTSMASSQPCKCSEDRSVSFFLLPLGQLVAEERHGLVASVRAAVQAPWVALMAFCA